MGDRAKLLKELKALEHIRLDGLRFRLIDAKGMVVGRLAIEIAKLLQGKDKPVYNPKHNMGDVVVVVNAAHVHFTNDQWKTKLYRWHTGYPGGLRERAASDQWDKDPTSILRKAVFGMLPSNRMRTYRMDKLKIYPEADHPFKMLDLVPYIHPQRGLKLPGLGWPLPEGLQAMNPEKYAFRAIADSETASSSNSKQRTLQRQAPEAQPDSKHRQDSQHKPADFQKYMNQGLKGLEQLLTEDERKALHAAMQAEQR